LKTTLLTQVDINVDALDRQTISLVALQVQKKLTRAKETRWGCPKNWGRPKDTDDGVRCSFSTGSMHATRSGASYA
jgi:hypothetical protein